MGNHGHSTHSSHHAPPPRHRSDHGHGHDTAGAALHAMHDGVHAIGDAFGSVFSAGVGIASSVASSIEAMVPHGEASTEDQLRNLINEIESPALLGIIAERLQASGRHLAASSRLVTVTIPQAGSFRVPSDHLLDLEQRVVGREDMLALRTLMRGGAGSSLTDARYHDLIGQAILRADGEGPMRSVNIRRWCIEQGQPSSIAVAFPDHTYHVLAEDVPSLLAYCSSTEAGAQAMANSLEPVANIGWMVRLAIELTPVIGEVAMVYEAVTGRAIITGEELSPMERVLLMVGPIVGACNRAVAAYGRDMELAEALVHGGQLTPAQASRAAHFYGDYMATLSPGEIADLSQFHEGTHAWHEVHQYAHGAHIVEGLGEAGHEALEHAAGGGEGHGAGGHGHAAPQHHHAGGAAE